MLFHCYALHNGHSYSATVGNVMQELRGSSFENSLRMGQFFDGEDKYSLTSDNHYWRKCGTNFF